MGVVNLELWLMIIRSFLVEEDIKGALEILDLLIEEERGNEDKENLKILSTQ